jgi:predicted nuclease with TOPRIM domain
MLPSELSAAFNNMQCPCNPGIIYSSLGHHKRSRKHKNWEKFQERLKDRDDTIERLIIEKYELLLRVKDLEKTTFELKHNKDLESLTNELIRLSEENHRLMTENFKFKEFFGEHVSN